MSKAPRPIKQTEELHPSVAALLQAHIAERDPKKIMRHLAHERVTYAKSLRWEGPPFCPKMLCSMFGIRCFEVSHDIGGDGRILRGADGRPRIEYAGGRMEERQRFTIFHELAHTFFPDYCEFLPHHHGNTQVLTPAEKAFEKLCDVAASEMLFPSADFTKDLSSFSRIGFPEIIDLRKRYHASIDATCYKLAEKTNSLSLCVAFLTDQRGEFQGRGPLWVKNSSGSRLFKSYLSPGTVPPVRSVAMDCYNGDMDVSGAVKETWWLRGSPRTYLVQAARLPNVDNPDYPKVVVLLLPQSYKGGTAFSPEDGVLI
jgi:Zn-dependent peptidase ImmA (M78 family)